MVSPSISKMNPLTYRSISIPILPNKQTTYTTSVIIRTSLRITQFIFAIAIAGTYGADLQNFTKKNDHAPAAWIYAEVVAVVSVLACVLHCWINVKWLWASLWNFIIAIMWAAQGGYFGMIVANGEFAGGNERQMKAGVGIGLTCMMLWLVSFVQDIMFCCQARKVKKANGKRVDRTIEVVMESGRCETIPQMAETGRTEGLPDYEDVLVDEKKGGKQ